MDPGRVGGKVGDDLSSAISVAVGNACFPSTCFPFNLIQFIECYFPLARGRRNIYARRAGSTGCLLGRRDDHVLFS